MIMYSDNKFDSREPGLTIGAFNQLRELGYEEVRQRANNPPNEPPNHLSLVVEVVEEPKWQEKAACKGEKTQMFYPKNGIGVHEAIQICDECIVRDECLDYATTNEENFGIWGGKSERQRRKINRKKNQ